MKVTADDDARIQVFFDMVDQSKLEDMFIRYHILKVGDIKGSLQFLDLLLSTGINSYFYNPLNIPKDKSVRDSLMFFKEVFRELVGSIQRLTRLNVMGVPLSSTDEPLVDLDLSLFKLAYKNVLLAIDHKITHTESAANYQHFFESRPDGIYFLNKKINSSNSKQTGKNGYLDLLKTLIEKYPSGQKKVLIKEVFGNIVFNKLKQALDKNTKGLWGYLKDKKNIVAEGSNEKIISFNQIDGKNYVTFINSRAVQ